MATFGERFKLLRETKGFSQIEIAKILNLANSTISQYETNKRIPDPDSLEKIADYFNVSLDYLMGRSEIKDGTSIKVGDKIYTIIGSSDFTEEEWKKITDSFETIVAGIKAQRQKK